RARLFRGDDGAPGRTTDRIARNHARHDSRGVGTGRLAQVYALDRGVAAILVADEQVRRMIVIWPQRDLIGRVVDCARYERRLEIAGEVERLHAQAVERTEGALAERILEAEQLHGVLAQLSCHELSEVGRTVAVGQRPGAERQHGDAHTHHTQTGQR